jgi:hypothetical protein
VASALAIRRVQSGEVRRSTRGRARRGTSAYDTHGIEPALVIYEVAAVTTRNSERCSTSSNHRCSNRSSRFSADPIAWRRGLPDRLVRSCSGRDARVRSNKAPRTARARDWRCQPSATVVTLARGRCHRCAGTQRSRTTSRPASSSTNSAPLFPGRAARPRLFLAVRDALAAPTGAAPCHRPLQIGVLELSIPSVQRCYRLGQSLRQAIESYPRGAEGGARRHRVGLSDQVQTSRT